VGVLCRKCAQDVAPCDGLIPEHIRSTVEDPDAWVVDGFGVAHPIAERSVIGRKHEGELVVLAASVSREHAELKKSDTGWTVRDLGSRNGTFVDGARCQGRVQLPARAQLKIGDVAMWFLAEVADEPMTAPSMETGSIGGGLVRYLIQPEQGELCVVGSNNASSGGTLLSRRETTAAWTNHELPPLEFQLLRVLCLRAIAEANLPSTVRGCVATKQLAKDLPFQSKYANEENVRQVVRRLRTALGEVGAEGVLSVAPGRGYYLSCPVTATGA
jgi:hypothetical protein